MSVVTSISVVVLKVYDRYRTQNCLFCVYVQKARQRPAHGRRHIFKHLIFIDLCPIVPELIEVSQNRIAAGMWAPLS